VDRGGQSGGATNRMADGSRRPPGRLDLEPMQPLRAHVHNGRLVMDEPTELPEGLELTLTVADETDDFDDDERARLRESPRRGIAQARAGELIDADAVISKLLARG
jgi:hypothetical protein